MKLKYKNYYKILELRGPQATDEEIKSSYRKLVKAYHPDLNKGILPREGNSKDINDINEAYNVLGDKRLKKRYNIRYRFHTLQNIDFDEGIREFTTIFVGKDSCEEGLDSIQDSVSYDDIITLSLSQEEIRNGVEKTILYSLPNGKTKSLTIKVPTDSKNGTKIRLKGEGHQAEDSLKKGDLYILIDVLDVDVNIKLWYNLIVNCYWQRKGV